jgi:phosphoketolase
MDAYWRAANYLSVGQIYLLDNPLLREPLRSSTSSRGCSATGAPRRA